MNRNRLVGRLYHYLAFVAPLFYALAALAQTIPNPLGPGVNSFTDIINSIANFALLLVTPIAVLVILYAATLFMFSAGDVEKVKKAKRALLWAVVGLAIVLTGRGIIFIIQDVLRGGGAGTSDGDTLPDF